MNAKMLKSANEHLDSGKAKNSICLKLLRIDDKDGSR